MPRLISRQIMSKHNDRICICDGCLQYYDAMEKLKLHQAYDCNHVSTKLPATDMALNKYGVMKSTPILRVPILMPIQYAEPDNENSFSVKTFEHAPFSFCFYIKCSFDDSVSQIVQYRGSIYRK
nr:unnamed protein product [Callosobruchus analis]